ncbi:MAG: hypothetical protein AB7O96_04365 [Pseudobdellovibrionaceae bacterium]
MKIERTKTKKKSVAKMTSLRVSADAKNSAEALLKLINNKQFGRNVRACQLFAFALGLVTEAHIKVLQAESLTNEDRKEILRQKYIETHGEISRDAFTGFLMSAEFPEFMKQNSATFGSEVPQLMSHKSDDE